MKNMEKWEELREELTVLLDRLGWTHRLEEGDEPMIQIDTDYGNFTIYDESLMYGKGSESKYVVEQWHTVSNYPHAPDDVAEETIGEFGNVNQTIIALLRRIATNIVDTEIENRGWEKLADETRRQAWEDEEEGLGFDE